MKNKWNIENAEKLINERGYNLISRNWSNNKTRVILEDKEGYYYSIIFDSFLTHDGMKFHSKNPYTIKNIKLWLIINNIEFNLLTEKYINNYTKLMLSDDEGYLYNISFNELHSFSHPQRFEKRNPYTIQNIKLWCTLNDKPFELVSDQYIDSSKNLKWLCLKEDCGDVFSSSWNCIQSGQGCGVCHGLQVTESNCFATHYPELLNEWHITLNGKITPYNITHHSGVITYWKCNKCGHEWHTHTYNRANGHGCPQCALDDKSGENCYMWKGGVSPINQCLRDYLYQWKKDSMMVCNYKCIFTNEDSIAIHHLYGFNMILNEIFEATGLKAEKSISDYSDSGLKLLKDKCLELHKKYGLGICLHGRLHKLFHSEYGGGDNTIDQFRKFTMRLENNEFNNYLKENKLELNINYKVLSELLK